MSETVWHLFVDCDHARACWLEGNLWHKLNTLCYNVEGPTELFLSLFRFLDQEEVQRAMLIAWALWRGRNNIVWNEKRETPTQQVYMAMVSLVEWQAARPPSNLHRQQTCKKWHAPCLGFVKINVDAAFFEDSLEMGLGMIVHDDIGEFIYCRSLVRPGVMGVDEGEAWGIVEAIKWAIHLGLDRVVVESDSKHAVEAMKKKASGSMVIGDFVGEGRQMLEDKNHFSISWTSRNANNLTHIIARTSREFNSPHCWVEPPIFVDGLLDRCILCT